MMAVAAAAGVSQATVSLVLSGSKGARLTDETRRRALQAAQELGYKFVRRGSRTEPGVQQGTIIFMADEIITDPWMSLAFEGARDKALEAGINAVLCVSHADADLETSLMASFDKLPVLGVVYGTILTRLVQIPASLANRRLVLLNCYDEGRAHHSILPGDVLGGRAATEHLLKTGRKRIGFINGQQGVDAARDRLKGYRQALASNDVPFDASLVRPGNWEPTAGYAMTLELMALAEPPDAIFCANDMMALGCYDALRQLGKEVPRDVAVIGFDDRDLAQSMHPPLSTLVLPLYEMGRVAVELMLDDIGGLHSSSTGIKVECKLIERESTRDGHSDASDAAAV
ncbi:MAG: LacI family DNA-binding transcriptional regulator [Proteobacteria bacterium]|nr:MAG: LacI family DNA-binding transcriptional regulator [Pseudomonadota bacterium]